MRPVLYSMWIPLVLFAATYAPLGARAAVAASGNIEIGHGRNQAEARQNALDNAREAVVRRLNEKYGAISWTPDADFLVRRDVDAVHLGEPKKANAGGLEEDYQVEARWDLTPMVLEKMQAEVRKAEKAERDEVVYQRHMLVGRVLAALVALFLVIAGYLRLEDLTRGYYTMLLRVGAGAVLALTVALVAFLRF